MPRNVNSAPQGLDEFALRISTGTSACYREILPTAAIMRDKQVDTSLARDVDYAQIFRSTVHFLLSGRIGSWHRHDRHFYPPPTAFRAFFD